MADDGWFVNIPWAQGFRIECAHHLKSRGRAWVAVAWCGERGRAWVAVALNPGLERIPRCPKCRAVGAAEPSTEKREQLQPAPPPQHRSPRPRRYQRVVI